MQTILFPTDFSENAKNALDFGLNLLNPEQINLVVLNAIYMSPASADVVAYDQQQGLMELSEVSRKNLEAECDRINSQYNLKNCQPVLKYGSVSNVVEEAVSEFNPQLVLMGTHGASGIGKYIIGSNTAGVIEDVEVPLLAIPAGLNFQPLSKILFATDFNDSDIGAIAFLSDIARKNNFAEVIIYHVGKGQKTETEVFDWFEEMVKDRVGYSKLSFRYTKNINVEEALNDFIEQNKIGILAMSTRKRGLLGKFLSRSMTKNMAYHSKVPLFAFHVKENHDILNVF